MCSEDVTTRAQQRCAWVRSVVHNPAVDVRLASMDAGARSYWRIFPPSAAYPFILMDVPAGEESLEQWLQVQALWHEKKIRVPQVVCADIAQGFALLEDLGTKTALDVINAENADHWFALAIDQLVAIQQLHVPSHFAQFDDQVLQRDAHVFQEWFLERHLGVECDTADLSQLAHIHAILAESIAAQPQGFVHRDFMLRNLMPLTDGALAVIDFQDCLRGPLGYDPMSLFRDTGVTWPRQRVLDWLKQYHARALCAGIALPKYAQFLQDAELSGIQRHLKVLGIFARLHYRDNKSRYLKEIPRIFAHLEDALVHYPQLSALHSILERHVRPKLHYIAS